MYLKSINLKGFKSFPDRTRLTFTPGVSVIVGPNGSGKSNVTDAVLWALGEQSPQAVRGSAMRDVIFAGGKGQSARRFAEVEVVIDNSEGLAATEFSEISITRRIERDGDGEYRLNGARCRLADVMEILSDTNMGREMHSVISQGKVEQIVNSKPRDRRMLIEEAAGLGKHRKRRHRAQLKLERTRDNLDRALDVEREARARLRPLKRQAEAAERTAKLVCQEEELSAELVATELRAQQNALAGSEAELAKLRERRDQVEAELAKVRERRAEIEERVASGEDERRAQAQRLAEARGAVERLRARIESVESAERELRGGLGERQLRLTELDDEPEAVTASAERIAELEAELQTLKTAAGEPDAELEQLRAQATAAAEARGQAQEVMAPLVDAAQAGADKLERVTRAREMARAESEKAAQRLASLQGELAAVEAKLARAAMEGDDEVLAGLIETGPGIERALSAALGEHLRAIVVGSVAEGVERIGSAEGASRALVTRGEGAEPSPPVEGARRLLDLVKAEGAAGEVASRLLADAWIVDTLTELPDDFTGIAVTVDGEAYDGSLGELRSVPREGTDPALAARSQREELVSRVDQRERTVERAQGDLDRAEAALTAARAERDETDLALREARRALDEATEEARRASWLADKRAEREQGPTTLRRAQLDAELAAERRHAQAAERLAAARRAEGERLRRRIETETETLPALAAAREALARVLERVERRADAIGAPGAEHGGEVAQELRECSKLEFELGGRMRQVSEALTTAEVGTAQLRDRRDESRAELERLAASLDRELGPAEAPLGEAEREEIGAKLERLTRRREQIGPVNPLAAREYEEASEHVRELTEQRKDLEQALTEIKALIRRTDREIEQAFEETFDATARNFEEMVAELFPGGKGRLRKIEVGPPRPPQTIGAATGSEDASGEEDEEEGDVPKDEAFGVEIEVAPAGKSTRRLSLLSGGEKSLVALAFVFAVLMARPCPFYILDEVEAALDDINIDRFLRLVRRFSERSQFIVVTHQKRTMDAADILYGVSMGGDGITKVVSRRLPRDGEFQTGDVPEADAAEQQAAEAA
ncbi:MAG: chromosome segregation SMC family protein [Solirubrobacterales bacterium]